ncbi:MAG: hypothetical protein AB1716_13470 [Planctomycetota bacterium]
MSETDALNRRLARATILSIAAAVCCSGWAGGDVLHVPGQYATIQAAIDAAANGDTVLVADGVYRGEGNRDIELRGKAITVRSEHGPASCIIDCEGTELDPHRAFCFRGHETRATTLDGFSILNGNAPYDPECYYSGGGIACNRSSPTIRNCIICNCVARDY